MTKKQKPKFKTGDVVRITFVAEVAGSWVDHAGKVCYALDDVVGAFPEGCLKPWVEEGPTEHDDRERLEELAALGELEDEEHNE